MVETARAAMVARGEEGPCLARHYREAYAKLRQARNSACGGADGEGAASAGQLGNPGLGTSQAGRANSNSFRLLHGAPRRGPPDGSVL